MNTDRENWIESHPYEYEFYKSIEWIEEKYPKVYEQYWKDAEEHAEECRCNPYYRYAYGGGIVPVPCCRYCEHYDGDRCHVRWNNNDEDYYNPDLDDKDPGDLCEYYDWDGEWEDEDR